MYYIYYMRDNRKIFIDYGKYYKTPGEASKRIKKLSDRYRRKCLIGFVPSV